MCIKCDLLGLIICPEGETAKRLRAKSDSHEQRCEVEQ